MPKKPICLIIRDGWGAGKKNEADAIHRADTPHTDAYEQRWPTVTIKCSGLNVGLPDGYQGNSEVGHLNIGAGRVVYQSLTRIDKSIADGDFFENETLIAAIDHAKEKRAAVHLMGLIQEEGVHAVTRHCHALLDLCKRRGVDNVLIHALTDGRDTPPKSAKEHMAFLQEGIERTGVGKVATVIGRYYAMDRDKRWDRTELAYRALMSGEGEEVGSWEEAIEKAYAAGENDEFIKPRIVEGYPGAGLDDAMIFFNFRFDRTRQLTQAIVEPDFGEFNRVDHNIRFVAMTHYYDDGNFAEAFPEVQNRNVLGEVLAQKGLTQLRCAETEKYAHVTFFFNALRNEPFDKEERILVPSPKVATYDLQPEMSVYEVRDKLLEAIASDSFDVIITNLANCDMVGHTGVYEAIIQAVQAVDTVVHDVVEAVLAKGGACLVTADHGNAEQTKLNDGSPMTAHTTNDVPIMLIGAGDWKLRDGGRLADIAPTLLQLLQIEQPSEMTGESLLVK
ncbi:MAG: 2,3-bisphosphoglycerate-independent phosphoglycerate mutase [Chitinivibrionales bacterium]|nr:2,3-bisphosphoglycerate-independent phosphoglycerate mutase [Chitinivibrionales bacterium]